MDVATLFMALIYDDDVDGYVVLRVDLSATINMLRNQLHFFLQH
jgi:hypothetical protein